MSYGVNSIQIHKKLRLDKRAGSDNWYARLTLPNGKRLVKTTKTEDIESAKEVALRLYYEVDARIQNKLPATTRKFGDVAKHAIARMETEIREGVGKQRGIACGVENATYTKIETNTKPIATTARARCEANIKGCSKQDLCAISTFTSSTGKRKWRAGDFKKFADEAKQRGIACGVQNNKNPSINTSKDRSVSNKKTCKTDIKVCTNIEICKQVKFAGESEFKKYTLEAQRRGLSCGATPLGNPENTLVNNCPNDVTQCDEKSLCDLATWGDRYKNWRVGPYRKFVTEAKRRGLTCNIPKWKNAPKPKPKPNKERDNFECTPSHVDLLNVAAKLGFITASKAQRSNIKSCYIDSVTLKDGQYFRYDGSRKILIYKTKSYDNNAVCYDSMTSKKYRSNNSCW